MKLNLIKSEFKKIDRFFSAVIFTAKIGISFNIAQLNLINSILRQF